MFDDYLENIPKFVSYDIVEADPEEWVISNISVPEDGHYTIGTVNTRNPLEYEVTKIPREVFNTEIHYVGKLLKVERRRILGGN